MPPEGQFSRNPEILDATGFSGDGSLLSFGELLFVGRTDTPADPPSGHALMWYDKTNNRLCIKRTDTDGNTSTDCISPMTGETLNGDSKTVQVTDDGKIAVDVGIDLDHLMTQLLKVNEYLAEFNDDELSDDDVEEQY